jgi:hypothetical protein
MGSQYPYKPKAAAEIDRCFVFAMHARILATGAGSP